MTETIGLDGRVAVVTGAGRGIGRARLGLGLRRESQREQTRTASQKAGERLAEEVGHCRTSRVIKTVVGVGTPGRAAT
jgi:NAD(P)-dependent dehydrogenase (short-subunit alcohol dehydrogenase family)